MKQLVIITAIVAAASLAIAGAVLLAGGGLRPGWFGPGSGAVIDEATSLPTAGVGRIVIETVSEDVRVTVGPGDTVEVRLHGSANARERAGIPHLSAEQSGDTIAISVDRDQVIGFHWSRLVLDVTIPGSWAGALSVGTVSADVSLPGMTAASVAVRTVSGDAALGAIRSGEVSFHTTSGTLRAQGIDTRQADLASVSGDMTVDLLAGSVRASSTSGDISLTLPADAGFRLDARAVSGRVTCAFPITVAEAQSGGGSHTLVGTVGDAGREVSIRTVSGDIALKR